MHPPRPKQFTNCPAFVQLPATFSNLKSCLPPTSQEAKVGAMVLHPTGLCWCTAKLGSVVVVLLCCMGGWGCLCVVWERAAAAVWELDGNYVAAVLEWRGGCRALRGSCLQRHRVSAWQRGSCMQLCCLCRSCAGAAWGRIGQCHSELHMHSVVAA